ncbi:hypothetical protein ATC03_10255 [Agromyces aureus]|uniref:Uncharacterized protein n=2 Tax=Agromyces aureus TaxID=453304 RepID=A0A191WFT8_9MICO|nr:hypothetical protein ATC03_10255 [Agromyces aureus]
MVREVASPPEGKTGNSFSRLVDRVGHSMSSTLGGSQAVDANPEDPRPLAERPCPLCGHAMGEHRIDHSTPNSMLECPTTDRLPERAIDTPLNELGMPIDR